MEEVIGNEAVRLKSTPLMRIVNTGNGQIFPEPDSVGLPCDISHVAGTGDYAPDDFLKRIKLKIPKTNVKVMVGSTGYIIWPEDFPDNHYTLDKIGRTVGKIDGIRFFQRYTSKGFLVSDRREDFFTSMSPEEKEDILKFLDSFSEMMFKPAKNE
jgi:hypothetical protein